MSDAIDAEKSLDQMKTFTELRGLRPNTVYTFAHCARRFLAHAGKAPADIKAADVESFLLDLSRKGRSPQTRNVNLSAVRCRCLGLRRAHFFPLFEQALEPSPRLRIRSRLAHRVPSPSPDLPHRRDMRVPSQRTIERRVRECGLGTRYNPRQHAAIRPRHMEVLHAACGIDTEGDRR
jgi:hypothetical protein